jgi:ADP-ribosylglycohydrolase
MKNPNTLMLLRICQADAYGMATEYINPEKKEEDRIVHEQAVQFKRYLRHPRHGVRAGCYGDDGQMSIGCADVLLAPPGTLPGYPFGRFSKEAYAEAWVRCFKRDQRKGYSRNFQRFLESIKDGDEFLAKIISTSNKNGAAMRSVPFGVFKDPRLVVKAADLQASITHNTQVGRYGAQAVALMSHFAMYTSEPWESMATYVYQHLPEHSQELWPYPSGYDPELDWPGKRVTNTIKTIHAIATLLLTERSLKDILLRAIRWGGDTDSVAGPCWGIASARYSGKSLPDWLYWGLEPGGLYGPKFLENAGQELMKAFA